VASAKEDSTPALAKKKAGEEETPHQHIHNSSKRQKKRDGAPGWSFTKNAAGKIPALLGEATT